MRAIVSDATALIVLAKLSRTELLQSLFTSVIIPHHVKEEIIQKNDYDCSVWDDPFFIIYSVIDTSLLESLELFLDKGESEAITLAKELSLPLLIDEKKGRKIAQTMHIEIIGLVGLIAALYRRNIISSQEAITIIDEAQQIGFRLSDKLYNDFCKTIQNK
jgi:predicted nucleic acid-binding protein